MDASTRKGPVRRRWRYYVTPSGERPVDTYIDGLTDDDAARVLARMAKIRVQGTSAARHLVEDLWEVRVDGHDVTHRILFTEEGSKARILLAIVGFTKKSPKTPPRIIKVALKRRDDWRTRGT